MAALAMGFRSIRSGEGVSTQNVFPWRDRLEVLWVHAPRITTKVVKEEALRNRPD